MRRAAIAAAVALAGCGAAASNGGDLGAGADLQVAAPMVPTGLEVPDSSLPVILRAHAIGTQNYTCAAAAQDGGAAYAWGFTAPVAMLFDDQMNSIGMHFAGPTWQLNDGSQVVGKVMTKVTVDATAIPWLLLTAASTSGAGVLTRAQFIQRLNTTAGLSPSAGSCDANSAGSVREVAYTADYYFYGTSQ